MKLLLTMTVLLAFTAGVVAGLYMAGLMAGWKVILHGIVAYGLVICTELELNKVLYKVKGEA